MYKRKYFIPALVVAIAFLLAANQAWSTDPYLEASKSIAQTWIYVENKGTPDKADITITISGKGDAQITPQDVVFAIDSSGSMAWSDPNNLRRDAAKYYVDQLDSTLSEQAATVDFDENAILVRNHHLSTNYPQVKSDIDLIDSSGSTNIPAAISVANDELIANGNSNHAWIVILLTDGQNWCQPYGTPCPRLDGEMDDVSDPLIQEAITNHIAYYTIGLGTDVNVPLLQNLAQMTGGSYYSAPDASVLQEIYEKIRQQSTQVAGKKISLTETLTTAFDYVPGSFSIQPTTLNGKIATWDINTIAIGEDWSVTFQVKSPFCGDNQQVDGDSTIDYTDFADQIQGILLPPVFLDVICDLPPELSGIPPDETVECDAVPEPVDPNVTGNCDTGVDVTFKETRTDGSCPGNYTLNRTWTAKDYCENTTVEKRTITVQDTEPPEITGVPPDVTVECNGVPSPASPIATDNCDPAPKLVFEEKKTDGNCPNNYILTRTWTAKDICGNTKVEIQVVTVQDTKPPVLSGVPPDVTVECDAVPAPASPTALDNCDPAPKIVFDEKRTDGNCPYNYTLTRTWTTTDICGNASAQIQIVTVQDTKPPVLSGVPPDETVECDAVPPPAAPTALDNCDPAPKILFDEKRTDGDCPYNYTLTRTWTTTDICGNASAQIQIVTVRDTTPPVVQAWFEPVRDDEDEDGDESLDKGTDEASDEVVDGLYTIHYSGTDNCSLQVDLKAYVNVFGNDETCDESPDFIGYEVQDGDSVKLNCSSKIDCVRNDEASDEGADPLIEITGPAMRLAVTGIDECRNEAKAEALQICPDPEGCITSITLMNSKGEEKTFYWFEYQGKRRDFEVGGEHGQFDWDCKTCLSVGDKSGTLTIICLQAGDKMTKQCKVPEGTFKQPCPKSMVPLKFRQGNPSGIIRTR